ncbi:MAG: LarC family nickel insertion protein, partial [Burkholderiales bacterium]
QEHDHRSFAEIRNRLNHSNLDVTIRQRSIVIFTLLAEVEGQIHGVPIDQVSFHELGGWDSIADIVGAAYLIESCGADTWSVGSLPKGSGTVKTAHGLLPVPSPATARLLEGFVWHDDGRPGERVTPTGAAILRYLKCTARVPESGRLVASGYGFGTRRFLGMSNTLRVLVLESAVRAPLNRDEVAVIEFEIDDQTAEDIALAVERLRSSTGVKDVLQMSAFGKKSRLYTHIQVICEPPLLEEIVVQCLSHTTTLGVRHHLAQRTLLPREQVTVEQGGRVVKVKIAERPGGHLTAKIESDEIARLEATPFAVQDRMRRETEALALANKRVKPDGKK